MNSFGRAIALACLLSATRLTAGTVPIDDFENPDPAAVIIPGFTLENGKPHQSAGLSSTVGDQRDVKIDVQGTPKPNSAQVLVGYDDQLFLRGVFQVATASSPGSVVTLQYDGLDDNPSTLTNGHGLNMFVLPDGGLTIDFATVDAPNGGLMDVAIRMYSNDAVATYQGAVAETAAPLSFYAPFDEFDVGDGFNFATVDSFEFVFNGAGLIDIDFVVDQIAVTVPEPSSLVVALLGVAGMFSARRFRR